MRATGETITTDTEIRAIRAGTYHIDDIVAEANAWLQQNRLLVGETAVSARKAGVNGRLCEFVPPIPNDPTGIAALNALVAHLNHVGPADITVGRRPAAVASGVDFSELGIGDDNPHSTDASWQ